MLIGGVFCGLFSFATGVVFSGLVLVAFLWALSIPPQVWFLVGCWRFCGLSSYRHRRGFGGLVEFLWAFSILPQECVGSVFVGFVHSETRGLFGRLGRFCGLCPFHHRRGFWSVGGIFVGFVHSVTDVRVYNKVLIIL